MVFSKRCHPSETNMTANYLKIRRIYSIKSVAPLIIKSDNIDANCDWSCACLIIFLLFHGDMKKEQLFYPNPFVPETGR